MLMRYAPQWRRHRKRMQMPFADGFTTATKGFIVCKIAQLRNGARSPGDERVTVVLRTGPFTVSDDGQHPPPIEEDGRLQHPANTREFHRTHLRAT